MQVGWKDLAHQCIIPYVEGHKLSEVHDMVKWVTRSIVHYEFGQHEPFGWFIANDMSDE